MTANDPVPQGDNAYQPDPVTTKLGFIRFDQIDDDAENFAFRDDDELNDVESLAEDLAVASVTRSEDQQLEPVGTGLERSRHPRRDADRIHRRDLVDLVLKLDPPATGEHDVDLLRLLVTVGKRLALAWTHDVKRQADRL